MHEPPAENNEREEVLALPLFAGLPAQARELAARSLGHQRLRAGDELVRENEPAERVYFLVSGEIAVRRAGAVVTLIDPPATIGLLAILDGKGRTASLSAFRDTTVWWMEREALERLVAESPTFAHNVIAYLAGELRGEYGRGERLLSHLADFFGSPNARMIPGPYRSDPFRMLIFVVEDSTGAMRRLLPDGVLPIPGNRYLLTYNFFDRTYTTHPAGQGKSFSYVETCPFVPCLVNGVRPAAFCPELYPDSYLAIAIGRELYGFPKRFGRTERRGRTIDLIVDQKMVLRATWGAERAVDARAFGQALIGALGGAAVAPLAGLGGLVFQAVERPAVLGALPRVPVLVRRQVVDVDADASNALAVDQLIEVPFEVESLAEFEILDRAGIEDLDLDHFLCGQCVGAFSLRMGFGFGARKLVRDYREKPGLGTSVVDRLSQALRARPVKR